MRKNDSKPVVRKPKRNATFNRMVGQVQSELEFLNAETLREKWKVAVIAFAIPLEECCK
ncbi:MAG: hypothetical protein WBI10_12445 [Syntrophales bacterium]